MTAEVALKARAKIGESITWVADQRGFYWIDVKAPALHFFSPVLLSARTWPLSSDVGGFALTTDGGAVVALRSGLFRLDLGNGSLARLAPPPFDSSLFRFNESVCNASGRMWIGVMFDPVSDSPPAREGSLYSFTFAEGIRREPDVAELHNGMAWGGDERTFYLSHSKTGEIFAFDHDRGQLSGRRLFATVPGELGVPDGAAVDGDGGYWCAIHGGGRLRRFRSDGSHDCDVVLPVSLPTMPAFGGEDLRTLYVTSATDKLTPEAMASERDAGSVLRLDVGRRGLPRPYIVR